MNIFKEIFKKETRYMLYVSDYSICHSYSTLQTGFKPVFYHVIVLDRNGLNIKLTKTFQRSIYDIHRLDISKDSNIVMTITITSFINKLKLILNKKFLINYKKIKESVFIKEYSSMQEIIDEYVEELL